MDNKEIALRLTEAALSSRQINLWLNPPNAVEYGVANGIPGQNIVDLYFVILRELDKNDDFENLFN